MKNPNDPTENRTHDLPACGALPQPTAPPRTHHPPPTPGPLSVENPKLRTLMGITAHPYVT